LAARKSRTRQVCNFIGLHLLAITHHKLFCLSCRLWWHILRSIDSAQHYETEQKDEENRIERLII